MDTICATIRASLVPRREPIKRRKKEEGKHGMQGEEKEERQDIMHLTERERTT